MRVEVYSVKDDKAAMGVYVDDVEVACPVIPYDTDGWLKDWSDGELNCGEAERKGITPDEVSEIIEHEMPDIRQQIVDKAKIEEKKNAGFRCNYSGTVGRGLWERL